MATIDIASDSGRRSRLVWSQFQRLLAHAAVVVVSVSLCLGQDARPTESQVKAAYLYNFGKFVTWPGDAPAKSAVFEICVLGRDPFGSVLDATVTGESIDRKRIGVARIARIQDGAGCNIVFISKSEEAHLSGIVLEAQRMRVLTVSDISHFVERGGTIGLVDEQDRIRFEVNRKTAEQSHLELSSELLKVAVRVIDKAAGRQ